MRSPLAKAHLAAALSYMGDRSRAFSAFSAAEEALGYDNDGDYYQTPMRDQAGVLALAAETGFNDLVARLGEKLGEETPEPDQLTTQEKAFMDDNASISAAIKVRIEPGGERVRRRPQGCQADQDRS